MQFAFKWYPWITTWQGSLGVNPNVLIGSSLVGILRVFFGFLEAVNSKFASPSVIYNDLLTK